MKARHITLFLIIISLSTFSFGLQISSTNGRTVVSKKDANGIHTERELQVVMDGYNYGQYSPQGGYYTYSSYFGGNAQFNVLIDTASPITWIPMQTIFSNTYWSYGYNCTYSYCTISNASNTTFNTYVGQVQGEILTLYIEVWDYFYSSVVSANYIDNAYSIKQLQMAGIGSKTSNPYFQGVLGLGLYNSSTGPSYSTILDSLYTSSDVNANNFVLFLQGNPYQTYQQWYLYFNEPFSSNYYNNYATQSNWWYVSLANDGEWSFQFSDYSLDDNSETVSAGTTTALIASGSQYIGVPQNDFNQILDYINDSYTCSVFNNTGIWCKCASGNYGNMPNITIKTLQTQYELSIPPWSYVIYYPYSYWNDILLANENDNMDLFITELKQNMTTLINQSNSTTSSIQANLGTYYTTSYNQYGGYEGPFYQYASGGVIGQGDLCQILIQPVTSQYGYNNSAYSNYWILGIPFLQSFLTMFDQDNFRLGFAPAYQSNLYTLYSYSYSSHHGMTTGALVGTILGSVGTFILFAVLIGCCCKKAKQRRLNRKNKNPQVPQAVLVVSPQNYLQQPLMQQPAPQYQPYQQIAYPVAQYDPTTQQQQQTATMNYYPQYNPQPGQIQGQVPQLQGAIPAFPQFNQQPQYGQTHYPQSYDKPQNITQNQVGKNENFPTFENPTPKPPGDETPQ
jgi:hypothetical protein